MSQDANHPDSAPQDDDRVSKTTLILAVVATIVGTFLALEQVNMIRHNDNKDDMPIAEFRAIFIEPGQEQRISYKPSNQHAVCVDGYLFIKSDTDSGMQGIVVDYKNRGVQCRPVVYP